MQLPKAAALVEDSIEDTLTYTVFPKEYWRRIRTNNALERLMREIRRRADNVPEWLSVSQMVSQLSCWLLPD